MTLKARLKEITKNKPEGERWYCYQIPEEFHVWTHRFKWKKGALESYGVQPLHLVVHGVAEQNNSDQTFYTKRKPLKLKCGIAVQGQETKSQSQTFNFKFRADSTEEINEALEELRSGPGYDINSFDVYQLEVFNKETNAILKADRHNPDGNGSSFYVVGFYIDNELKLYPELNIGTAKQYIGRFHDRVAHCSNKYAPQKYCAIKASLESPNSIRKQTKLRKAK